MNKRHTHILMLCISTMILIFASACTSGPSTETVSSQPVLAEADARQPQSTEIDEHQAFWNTLKITGAEAETYPSLNEMADSADIVVVGTFADFAESRQITTDAPEDTVTYAAATLAIKEVIRGDMTADELPIEFLINQPADQVQETITEMATQLPSGELLLFLREKGGANESGLYRLVNSTGLWTATEANSLTAPLAEDIHEEDIHTDHESEPSTDDSTTSTDQQDQESIPYADELTDIASFSELVDYIRS